MNIENENIENEGIIDTEQDQEIEATGEIDSEEEFVEEGQDSETEEFAEEGDYEETEEIESYTKEDLIRAMELTEQKILAQLQQQNSQQEERAKPEEKGDLIGETLQEVFNKLKLEDDGVLTTEQAKSLIVEAFSALNQKAQQTQVSAETQVFQDGAAHYAQTYIPAMIKQFGLDPNSRDAAYIKSSFIEEANIAQYKLGTTQQAIQKAATQHMLKMRKEFNQATGKPVVKKAPVERKIAAGNTGGKPIQPGIDPETERLAERIKSGQATTAELLRAVNTRK